ncbi:ABC transporter permease [Engelhardtia mirabilis]|uniref:Macrolide export ATP-binding/permease protein MacB n=1 Tax=Engelhardtia mirabilis TaxID=2528011 RepID=A0A518BR07_9BACT|nr:Macrolide export ATP-binding/permease protein MacB [Planctomycetes bacterium Pla133]QDV03728.1 Macrolide export ATP-binding/permease protein MacB [Planctomycetes bacterium Pla86]
MHLVPFSYNLRSLFVRRSSTLLTIVGIGATVAVLSGVLSLQQGFKTLFTSSGREDVAVFLRPGSTNEGDSVFTLEGTEILIKSLPEFALDERGRPLAAAERYLAVRRQKLDGGETNVPIRGVQPMSYAVHAELLELVDGRWPAPGADEVIAGSALTGRIVNTAIGDVITLNTTPFRVVGEMRSEGPFNSELWGDAERIGVALERPLYNRVVGILREGASVAELARRLEDDKRVPAKVVSELDYLSGQTEALSIVLLFLGSFLASIMGVAAVFTGTNTMLASISARSHEIGIMRAMGFRPFPVFLAFLSEALLLGLLGGAVGIAMALPLNGVKTGTTNFQTFTEVAFAFKLTPTVLATAVTFAVVLGLLGGAWPAWRAARMRPAEALRRG